MQPPVKFHRHYRQTVHASAFQLTVWCDPSQAWIEPLMRETLADNLRTLRRRMTTTASGKLLCKFEAVVRGVHESRRQVVALLRRLEQSGIRNARWVSVLDPA